MRDSLGLNNASPAASSASPEPLSVTLELQTQSNILQSQQIALNVIKDLHLEDNADFRPRFSPIGYLLGIFSSKGQEDPVGASLDASPRRRQHLQEVFEKNLQIKIVVGTRLIDIAYSNPDPQVAAAVANDLVKQIINYNYQVRVKAIGDASKSLETELTGLRDRTVDLQGRVVALQKDTGLYGTGSTDSQGKPGVYNPVLERLQAATQTLAQAQSNRILKEAIYKSITSGNADLVSQLSGPASANASQGVMNSLSLIQTLREQEATLQAKIEQESVKFGPAYPPLNESRASLARIQKSLTEEIERIRSRAQNDLEIAKNSEAEDQAAYDVIRKQAGDLNDRTIDFTSVQQEANQSQALYQEFLRRLNEAGIVDGLPSASISVVNAAQPPAKPSSPNVPLYLTLGLVLGCFLGVTGAFLVDSMDGRIFAVDGIESRNLTLLGILPEVGKPEMTDSIPMIATPRSLFSESMLMVRSAMSLRGELQVPSVILVTSSGRGEGKSSVAVNLAVALSYNRKKVLIIEADLRRPNLNDRLGPEPGPVLDESQSRPPRVGLEEVLSRPDLQAGPFAELPGAKGVSVLPAISVYDNPAELLGSPNFQHLISELKKRFDFIVMDAPPALLVADAQLIAPLADHFVLVARFGATSNESLQRASNLLAPYAGGSTIGVVLNAVPPGSATVREYYGYQMRDLPEYTIDGKVEQSALSITEKLR